MPESTLNAGIILNGFVSAIVALTALTLVVFLIRRVSRLDRAMKSYTCFWASMFIVWVAIATRYFIVSTAPLSPLAHFFDIVSQTFVFLSGPTLFYYLAERVTGKRLVATAAAGISIVLAIVAFIYTIQPNGLVPLAPTFFSSETQLNHSALLVFNSESFVIALLLVLDLAQGIRQRLKNHDQKLSDVLFSLPILVYLILGSIEQSGLVADWTLVVFRIFYTATFLAVFMLMTGREAEGETFLLHRSNLPT